MTRAYTVLFGLALGLPLLAMPRVAAAQDECTRLDPPPPPECFPQESYGVSVTPDGGTAPTRPANTAGHSASFEVINTGSNWTGFEASCSGSMNVTCTSVSPSSFSLQAGGSTTVFVTYSVGAPGSGTISLTAWNGGAADGGSYSVPVVGYGVSVTPDGGTAATRPANTGGHSESFTVQNTGGTANTFSFSCSGAGGVTCGAVPVAVTLNAGASTPVTMPYSVGAPGTGTLTLTASGTNASNPGSYSVPIASYGVSVTPDGAVAPARLSNTGGYAETFTVLNTGSASNTFGFSCTGSGGITCGSVPAPVTVGAGLQTTVSMPYGVGSPGTGTLTLTATGTSATNAGSYSVPVALSIVSGGAFTKDSRYLLIETADTYDAAGRIAQLSDARGKVTTFQYGGNGNAAFLTQIRQMHDASGPVDLVTDIGYDGDGFVASIKDQGGTFKYFFYDLYGRLKQVRNHRDSVVLEYAYTYSRTSANGWTFQATTPNAVVITTFIRQLPTPKSLVSTEYLDGLGRPIQIVAQDGTQSIITATQYDGIGRKWRTWKPYTRVGAGYDPTFAAAATSFYNTYLGQSQAKPYVETQYTADALARVTRTIPEYVGTTPSTVFMQTGYGIDVAQQQRFTEVSDEAGKKRRIYTDLFGNEVHTILGYGAPEATTTLQAYNVLGQRIRVTDPRNLITTFTIDTRGLISARANPDAGTVSNKYDRAGNLRYTQDANQAAAGKVLFTTYDFANRARVTGEATATFSSLDPNSAPAFETTTANWLEVRAYDAKPSTLDFPWNLFSAQITSLAPANVSGRVAATASKSNGAWQVTLFSYDIEGQVDTRWTFTQANGGGSVLTALNTAVTYVRDMRDALLERRVTVGSATFNHWYDYDNRGLLWKVFAANTGTKPGTPDLTYTYRPSGQIQDRQFQGGPLVPLRYGIREQLEKIGDPASTAYPFSAFYGYHANGTIAEAQFYSAGSPAAEKRYRYLFPTTSYDALNRLLASDFQGWNGTAWTVTAAHDLAGITYDVDGNIKTLQRYQNAGSLVDNLTYAYPATSNRLSSVADAVGATAETWDAEAGGFTYDANGNVLTAPAPYSVTSVTYDHRNVPLSLTRSGVTSTYRYDAAGQRFTKQVGAGNTDVYVLDGPITLGVVTVDPAGAVTSREFNVVAVEKVVGRQPNAGNRRYYHTDLLGSTRAVVEGALVVESYDFEPWGLLMAGRTLGTGTREGFTGKEQDAESGLQYFGARYYMPALGRFAAVDPMAGKFPQWSPYTYTLDNPLALVDPDGQCPAFLTGKPCSGAIALAVGFIPVVGDIVDVASAVVGKDLLTGERLSAGERLATVVGTVVGSGRAARKAVNAVGAVAGAVADARQARRTTARANETVDAARSSGKVGGDAAQSTPQVRRNQAQGSAGEAKTEASLRGDGSFAGSQVTFETSTGQRTRIDFVTREGDGFGVVETKTGGANLTSGQQQLFDDIQNGRPVTPRGGNAAATGLTPGQPVVLKACRIDRPDRPPQCS